jgi:Sap, sulfolipid-1-addressing protein
MEATLSLGDLLPAAIGIALSPVPIAAVILMLFSPKARRNGPAFVAGWMTGLVLVGGALLLFAGDSAGSTGEPSTTSLWVKTVLGLLLLGAGVKQWRGRAGSDDEPKTPTWMQSIDRFSAGKSFGMAASCRG